MGLLKTINECGLVRKAGKVSCSFSKATNTFDLNFVLKEDIDVGLTNFSFTLDRVQKDTEEDIFEQKLYSTIAFLFSNLALPTKNSEFQQSYVEESNLKDNSIEAQPIIEKPQVQLEKVEQVAKVEDVEPSNTAPSNNFGAFVMPPPLPNNAFTVQAGRRVAPKAPSAPPPAVAPVNNDEAIKDVQKLAIQLQLSNVGLSYKEFTSKAFEFAGNPREDIPSLDDLTYQEAIQLIHYGNELSKSK